jgi:hypothetical protein
MGINRAEQTIDRTQENMLLRLSKDMRELKTSPQPIGGDILQYMALPAAGPLLAGPYTVAAGATLTLTVTATPDSSTLTGWDCLYTPYVDVVDAAHEWRGGASLTSGQRLAEIYHRWDWANSSDITNIRVFKIMLENRDSASHDYSFKVRFYLPKLTGSSA